MWAAASNFLSRSNGLQVNRRSVKGERRELETVSKRRRGKEKMEQGRKPRDSNLKREIRYFCTGRVPSFATADGVGLPT